MLIHRQNTAAILPGGRIRPEWINEIHTLFPKRTVRTIEEDALERYGMVELVTDKELLERVEPSETLLQAILQTKHLMSSDVLQAARQIVRKVVAALVEKTFTVPLFKRDMQPLFFNPS